jgi:hypothetical protein
MARFAGFRMRFADRVQGGKDMSACPPPREIGHILPGADERRCRSAPVNRASFELGAREGLNEGITVPYVRLGDRMGSCTFGHAPS